MRHCDRDDGGPRPAVMGYRPSAARRRQPAFTLAELVVSIGVLALMMTMAGMIFKLTLDSTGQATGLIETNQALRLLEQTLREDLAQTPRDGAVLVIEANPINAFWTQDAIEANPLGTNPAPPPSGAVYAHEADPEREYADGAMMLPRADVFMTFTARLGSSCLCPQVTGQVQQVVYGLAELGELDAATGGWVGGAAPSDFADHIAAPGTIFPTPAEGWHLARRSVLIVDGIVTDPPCPAGSVEYGLDDGSIPVATPDNLWDGAADIVAKDPGDFPPDYLNSFNYLRDVVQLPNLTGGVDLPDWFARSRLDLDPPAMYADRLGHYFIPNCASFKVEWALDLRRFAGGGSGQIPFNPLPGNPDSAPQELIWFDPGRGLVETGGTAKVLGELDDLAFRYTAAGAAPVASALASLKSALAARFDAAGSTGLGLLTPVWYANDAPNTTGSSDTSEPDRYFPDALRITVDVYDRARKLKRPLRHVMVLPVGR